MKKIIFFIFVTIFAVNQKLAEAENSFPNSDITGSAKKSNSGKLIEDVNCKEDVTRICGNDAHALNNFAILECIQNQERVDSALLNSKCHNVLWSYKYNFTKSSHIENLMKEVCKNEDKLLQECSTPELAYGNAVSCMIQNIDKLVVEKCLQYVVRLAAVVFSDYQLVQHMTEACKNDIQKFECGRIQSSIGPEMHSQGLTIECLSKHTGSLENNCQHQILRLAELQSEDFHLDRAFYFACREDRDKFCPNVRAGKGKVYQCLLKHKNDRTMSQDCTEQISRRENLIAHDFQVSRGLVRACKNAIKENQCRKGTSRDELEVRLSKILLCLEGALHQGKILEGECQQEILTHRQMLLDISPKIAENCKDEIMHSCSGFTSSAKFHCLIKLYNKRSKAKISKGCQRALEDVIKETDPAEDWRVDPVLYEACIPVVQSRCKGLKGGEGRVMRCLMRNINSPFMTDNCETALLEIQYFVARDWKLDPQLYKSCRNDSVKLCFSDGDWTNPTHPGADNSIMVLPCLFRYAYHPSQDLRLNPQCTKEVRRVMHERAAYVSLHPQIEMDCMEPLASLCSENTGPGEEILCLQKNLNKLGGYCLQLVRNYTEAESRDVGLNSLVMTHCSQVIEKVCGHIMQGEENDEDSVMDCLIQNKNSQEMRESYKCRAVVENFQIIMIKDIAFTPKFKQECHENVRQYCEHSHNRKEVLECLAERMMNDILNEDRSSLSKGCKQQIRKQLVQRHESINLDPLLQQACNGDIQKLCSSVSGSGMVLECLRSNPRALDPNCHSLIFEREREESADPSTDFILQRTCREMLKTFCRQSESENLFSCLMHVKDNPDFDMRCRELLTQRMVERSKDIRLNPELFISCRLDMNKFCRKEMDRNDLVERNGKVIECLKEQLVKKKLTQKCSLKIIQITKDAALNYKMDPVLVEKCNNEIKVLCSNDHSDGSENGEVEECLKLQLEQNNIKDEGCKVHIAEIMQREKADIHADPLLFQACSIDNTKFCADHEQGTHLACLFDILDRNSASLEGKCRDKLRERREMFKAALKVTNLESVGDLAEIVRASPQRNYLLIILFTVVGVIFLGGLACGRATRRSYKLLKNR